MVQRDVLKVQIEQLGKVLGKMLAAFLHQKSEGKVVQGMHIANEKIQAKTQNEIKDYTMVYFTLIPNLDLIKLIVSGVGDIKLIEPKALKQYIQKKHIDKFKSGTVKTAFENFDGELDESLISEEIDVAAWIEWERRKPFCKVNFIPLRI